MEGVGVLVLLLLGWRGVEVGATDATRGCSAYHLTGKEGATVSPTFPLTPLFPLALTSPRQAWQEFSFAFRDSEELPVGSLRAWRAGGSTELSLNVLTGDHNHNHTIHLTLEEEHHLSLRNWTFISFSVAGDELQMTFDDLVGDPCEMVFQEVNASHFREGFVRVPSGHSIYVALNCNISELGLDKVVPEVTTPPGPGGPDDDRSNTTVTIVALVLLGLLLVVAVWYWRGRRRSRRAEAGQRKPEGGTAPPEGSPLVAEVTNVVAENEAGSGHETQGRSETQNIAETQNAGTSRAAAESHDTTDDEGDANNTQTSNDVQKSTQSIYEPE